ncbi:MAG: allantoate amidohydrolase [Ktedonobacterales bacterium]
MGASGAHEAAEVIMARCDQLAACTEEPGRVTRRYGTAAMRAANELVARWMARAGMDVREDNAGNLIGRYEAATPGGRTLLLGSHLDSVRDAGRYDGPLGVLLAVMLVERLHARGERLPFAIEVLGFADEEGLRFHTAYLGSSVFAGTFDAAALALRDPESVALDEAILAFGGDPARLHLDRRDGGDLIGYCEVHIEQGPVLEARGLPVGIVGAIAGQTRCEVRFEGRAGHAGTVPMPLRRDALCAASEFVLAVEAAGRETDGLVATVGQLRVEPDASNVIPGVVVLSLDVRHQEDARREAACEALHRRAEEIARARNVGLRWQTLQRNAAVACSPSMTERLAQAVAAEGIEVLTLPSGAGHDGVSMQRLTDIAMLFVRCERGISHNPAESVEVADVAVAIAVMERFLAVLAEAEVAR